MLPMRKLGVAGVWGVANLLCWLRALLMAEFSWGREPGTNSDDRRSQPVVLQFLFAAVRLVWEVKLEEVEQAL